MVYEVAVEEDIITVEVSNPQEGGVFRTGEEVTLSFQDESIHLLPDEE